MEHMKMRWRIRAQSHSVTIETDEERPWGICDMRTYLPDDKRGEATAQAICDEHNRSL